MSQVWQVSTVAASKESAMALARSAVESRLAACAQVCGPVSSVFWHLGELGTGEEWQVFLKTTEESYPLLEAHLIEHHEWTNPEVTAIPLAAGAAPYLAWVANTTAVD